MHTPTFSCCFHRAEVSPPRVRGTFKGQLVKYLLVVDLASQARDDSIECGLHHLPYIIAHDMGWGLGMRNSLDVDCIELWLGDESDCVVVAAK